MIVDSSSTLLAQAAAKGTAGGASASPFVVAIQAAGINGLPSLINAWCVIFSRTEFYTTIVNLGSCDGIQGVVLILTA